MSDTNGAADAKAGNGAGDAGAGAADQRAAAGAAAGNGGDAGADQTAKQGADQQGKSAGTDAKTQSPADWRSAIADGELKEFASRFTTPADLAKAALDLRKANGTMIRVPGKDATPEQVKAFHKALGVPEAVEGYAFDLPEGQAEWTEEDKAFQKEVAGIMHKAGIPAGAAKELSSQWNKLMGAAEKQAGEQAKKAREEAEAALRKEWGPEFSGNQTMAKRALAQFGGDELVNVLENATLNGTKLGDHPAVIKAFAQIGRRTAEGGLLPLAGENERRDVQERIDIILKENPPGSAGYRDPKIQKELNALYSKQVGNAPLVGQGGRAV